MFTCHPWNVMREINACCGTMQSMMNYNVCADMTTELHMFFIPSKFSVLCCESICFQHSLTHHLPTSLIHTHISTQSNACDSMNESFDKSRTNKKIIVQSQDYYDVFQQNRHSNTISVFSHKVKKKNRTQNKIHCTNKRDDTCICVRFRLFF